jgi:signal transduction histidine kinase
VLYATPAQLNQIVGWVADFRKGSASIKSVAEIGLEHFDIYLVVMPEPLSSGNVEAQAELSSLVAQAALTPCLALGERDDEALVDAALAAGATDFLALPTLDATQLERSVQFGLRRRHVLDALSARETCLAAARERDRQQLANALHDGPLQDLIGARFLLGALPPGDLTADVQSSLQSVIQSVRSLCSDLKPPALGPFGLEKAIRAHMQGLQSRDPELDVTLELDVDNQQLPEWARLALFRVFQAAVLNVTKHAQASHVWVRLLLDEDQVRLTVADDGQGFALPSSWLDFARTERCGLLMMQERVDALGGRMMVQSTPGSGTRVMVQVPLDQPAVPLPVYLALAVQDRNR